MQSTTQRNRKRPIRILLFVDPEEKKIIDQKATELKMNRSEYLRAMATGSLTRPEKEDYAKLLKEIGAIGNNLNQIAKHTNQQRDFTDIKTFRDLLEAFRKWLYSKQ